MKIVSLLNKKEGRNEFVSAVKNLSDISLVDQKLMKEVLSDLEDYLLEIKSPKREKLRILCAGIYNSGKSSLLNILTESKNFKIGVVPTTDSIDQLESEDCIYVDTPGLNAKECDNKTALQAFKQADLILFVSNMQNGGLNAKEAEYLDGLNQILGGGENLKKQVLFLMSNLDQVPEDSIDKIKNEHQKNIESVTGYMPEIIGCYDAVTYQTGMDSKEDQLIQASRIKEVRHLIDQRISLVKENQEQIRETRLREKEEWLGQKIHMLIKPIKEEINKLEKQVKTSSIDKTAVQTAIQKCKKNFKTVLDKIKCPEKAPYSYYPNLSQYLRKYSILNQTSRSSLIQAMRDQLGRVYDKRERVVKDASNEAAQCIGRYTVYEQKDGNFYYDLNKEATECVLKCNDILLKLGVHLPQKLIEQICIVPQVTNKSEREIASDLRDNVVDFKDPYRLSDYIDYADISEDDEYIGEGFFGSKYKTKYSCYDLLSAVTEMEKDLSFFKTNLEYEWNAAKKSVQNFCNQLKKELQERQNLIFSSATKEAERDEGDARKTLAELHDTVTKINQYLEGVGH